MEATPNIGIVNCVLRYSLYLPGEIEPFGCEPGPGNSPRCTSLTLHPPQVPLFSLLSEQEVPGGRPSSLPFFIQVRLSWTGLGPSKSSAGATQDPLILFRRPFLGFSCSAMHTFGAFGPNPLLVCCCSYQRERERSATLTLFPGRTLGSQHCQRQAEMVTVCRETGGKCHASRRHQLLLSFATLVVLNRPTQTQANECLFQGILKPHLADQTRLD